MYFRTKPRLTKIYRVVPLPPHASSPLGLFDIDIDVEYPYVTTS